MTKYIPPVVRLEDDEELEDVLPQQEDGLESEDMFDQFFSSQGKLLFEIPPVVRLVRRCITTAERWIRIWGYSTGSKTSKKMYYHSREMD